MKFSELNDILAVSEREADACRATHVSILDNSVRLSQALSSAQRSYEKTDPHDRMSRDLALAYIGKVEEALRKAQLEADVKQEQLARLELRRSVVTDEYEHARRLRSLMRQNKALDEVTEIAIARVMQASRKSGVPD